MSKKQVKMPSWKLITGVVLLAHGMLAGWMVAGEADDVRVVAPRPRLLVQTVSLKEALPPMVIAQAATQQEETPAPSPGPVHEAPLTPPPLPTPAVERPVLETPPPASPSTPSTPTTPPPKKKDDKKPAAKKKAPPKKSAPKHKPAPSKPLAPENDDLHEAHHQLIGLEKKEKLQKLLAAASENIAKVDKTSDKKKVQMASADKCGALPGRIDNLHIDAVAVSGETLTSTEASYRDELSMRLRRLLKLPEFGELKLKLILERSGKVVKVSTVEAKSSLNKNYVESTLPTLQFPAFGKNFAGLGQYTFIITLKNE